MICFEEITLQLKRCHCKLLSEFSFDLFHILQSNSKLFEENFSKTQLTYIELVECYNVQNIF